MRFAGRAPYVFSRSAFRFLVHDAFEVRRVASSRTRSPRRRAGSSISISADIAFFIFRYVARASGERTQTVVPPDHRQAVIRGEQPLEVARDHVMILAPLLVDIFAGGRAKRFPVSLEMSEQELAEDSLVVMNFAGSVFFIVLPRNIF